MLMQGIRHRGLKPIEVSIVRRHGVALESAFRRPHVTGFYAATYGSRGRPAAEEAPGDRQTSFRTAPRTLHWRSAPVAQLDRAPGFEPGGRRFESVRARFSIKHLRVVSFDHLCYSKACAIGSHEVFGCKTLNLQRRLVR